MIIIIIMTAIYGDRFVFKSEQNINNFPSFLCFTLYYCVLATCYR